MSHPYILRKGVSTLSDLADGAAAYGYPGDYPGRVYFVNNITGQSYNNGLSWEYPFAEISQAITASESYRTGFATNNQFIRNIIYVQGTATAYSALTALPSHCSIIGVGASPYGNGSGIARINGGGTADAVTIAATVRGCEFYNMQFANSGSFWCVDLASAFLRGKFVNCSFLNDAAAADGLLRAGNSFAGNLIEDCQFSGDSGYPVYAIYFADSITMNNNIIRRNMIVGGTTAAIYVGASVNDVNTVFVENVIGAPQANDSAKAVDDNGPGYSYWAKNAISGTDAMEITNLGGNRALGNYVSNNGTGAMETTIA